MTLIDKEAQHGLTVLTSVSHCGRQGWPIISCVGMEVKASEAGDSRVSIMVPCAAWDYKSLVEHCQLPWLNVNVESILNGRVLLCFSFQCFFGCCGS